MISSKNESKTLSYMSSELPAELVSVCLLLSKSEVLLRFVFTSLITINALVINHMVLINQEKLSDST